MKRRDFITVLGGATAAWPLAARAADGRMRRIAMLVGATENDPDASLSSEAFRQTLNQLGRKEVSASASIRAGALAIPIACVGSLARLMLKQIYSRRQLLANAAVAAPRVAA